MPRRAIETPPPSFAVAFRELDTRGRIFRNPCAFHSVSLTLVVPANQEEPPAMTTTSHPEIDEAKVARDAAEFSRRLAVLDMANAVERIVADERRAAAQDRFDEVGLPRGLAPLESL